MADEKRSDYLKSLNKMRSGYQNSGNPLINAEDDSTNVGNELSSFAYMNTPLEEPVQSDSETGRNGWQRFVDTVNEPMQQAERGVFNFVDDIFDFAVSATSWLTGLTSGIASAVSGNGFQEGWNSGTGWAKDVIDYDWQSQAMAFMNQTQYGIINGDAFNGEKWAAIGNVDSAKKSLEEYDKSSFLNEAGDIANSIRNVESGIGYVLPSIALGIVTGGQSLGTQAALQGTAALASGYGSAVESALESGADYNQAMGYAAAKGAISGATTAATVGIGGSALNKVSESGIASAVGDSMAKAVGKATDSATVQHLSGIVGTVLTKAGISATEAGVKTLAEPVLKSIYDEGEAIEQAYAQGKIGEQLRDSMLQAAVTSTIISTAREVGNFATSETKTDREGKTIKGSKADSWNEKYFNQMAMRTEYGNALSEAKKITDSFNKKLGADINKLISGETNPDEINLSDQKYASVIDDYQKALDKWNEKYSGLVKTSLEKLPDNKYTKEYKATINNPSDSRLIGSDSKENKKFAELRQKVKMIAGQDVNAYGAFWSSFKKYQENQKTNKSESEEFDFSQKTDAEPYKGPAASFGVPEIKTDGVDTTNGLNLPISVANEAFSSAEISNALENMDSDKSYVVKKDGKAYSIQPTKDGSKNVVIEIDGKKNEIKDISVKDANEGIKFATILPKNDESKLKITKIKDESSKPIEYVKDGEKIIKAELKEDGSAYHYAIYSKNPLMESDIQEKLTSEKIFEAFDDLPKSLSKTIDANIKNGKIIDFLATRTSGRLDNQSILKTVEKLGFDGYFKNNGEAIVEKSALLSYPVKGDETDGRKDIHYKKEGKQRISTKEARREYVQRVKTENTYSERALGDVSKALQGRVKDAKIKVVDEKAYTSDMNAISGKVNEKWGIKEPVSFIISDGTLEDDIEGIHTKDGIYVVLDNVEGDIGSVVMHEAWHSFEKTKEHRQSCAEVTNELMNLVEELQAVADDEGMEGIQYGDGYGFYYAMLYEEYSTLQKEYGDDYDSIFSELAGDFVSGRISEGGKVFSAAPIDVQDFIGDWWKKVENEVSKEKSSYYSDTEGNLLSESQKEFFSKSYVRDRFNKNKLRVVYNATDVDFNTFNYSNIGKGAGSVYGPGFYFSFDDIGDEYGTSGGRKFYLNMVNPAKDNSVTFTENDMNSVIEGMDSFYDGKFSAYLTEHCAVKNMDDLFDGANNDVDLVSKLTKAAKMMRLSDRKYLGTYGDLAKIIYEKTGKDGIIIYHPKDGSVKQVVCWNPNAIKSIYNLSPNEDSDNVRFAKKNRLTNWINTEPTEKAKVFIEANKAKEPKKVGVFIANENFETTETEITVRKSEDGKWEVTAYDKFTGKTVKSKHSFKKWATSLRYISAVYGDDIKRVPTSKNEIAQANAPAKTSASAQANKQTESAGTKSKASPAKKTEAKADEKTFDKSENNSYYIANKDFSTQEKTVSIIYNENTGKYDVLTHDNYIDKDLPTRSFARFRGARKYAQNVFGELTKVENGKETNKKENSPVTKKISNGIAAKASDDKKTVTGEINGKKFKIDMGKIKVGKDGKTIRDSNSEPLFLIAEQYHKEAEKKFPETKKKIFDNICAKYGLTTALKNLQGEKLTNPSIKSISSFADRIKRNVVEKGNADPNILKDMIRGTYSFDEKSTIAKPNGLKGLVSDLQKISAKPIKLDAKNTPFYKAMHINLNYKGLNIEIQIHDENSWKTKQIGDKFYDKWRSVDENSLKGKKLKEYLSERKAAIENGDAFLRDELFKKVYDDFSNLTISVSESKVESYKAPTSTGSAGFTHLPSTSSLAGQEESSIIRPSSNFTTRRSDINGSSNSDDSITPLVTDKEKNSAAKLIEAGADVSKPLKVRLKDVRNSFVAAVKETLPNGSKFRISAGDVRETMAEIDLVKDKKKTPIVAENMLKRLKDIDITITGDEGDEKMKLGDFMSPEQEKDAFGILTSTLNGKARPTELAKWAKSLEIEKMVNKQNVRTFRLLATAKKRIANANKDYLSAPGLPPIEVGVYSKVFEGVKAPFTTASLKKLADNVIALYTDENFGQMLTAYGLGLDETTQSLAKALANSFEDGKKINYSQIEMGNAIMDLLNHEMSELAKGVRNANFEKARDTVTIAQAAFINSKPSKLDPIKNALSHIDNSIRSPISVLEDEVSEFNPYVIHLEDGGKACENAQRAKINEFNEMVFGKNIISECGFKNVDELNRELNGKFMLHGYKITIAKALKIINTYKTAKDPLTFFKRGISLKINGRRTDILDMTQENIDNLNAKISDRLQNWNEKAILSTYNGAMREYTQGCFKRNTGVELTMADGIYYPTSAVGDKAPDLNASGKGSVNPNDFGLNFFKERVKHTNAPFNMDGDVVSDMNGRIIKLTLWGEWSQWYKELRILEDTPVYGKGTTLNATLEKNMPDWPILRDFVHRIALGVGYDDSVSFLGRIDLAVGGALANLSQVAMMDIFTQIKTLGSDFTGWQYFGVKNVLEGLASYYANGGIIGEMAARKIIERYSPTLEERFNSMEAFNANIGKVTKGRINKALTTPVRYLDAHIHFKAFYMALEQAKGELGSGATQEQIEERAVRILEKFSDTTQPTTSKFRVGMYRSGANGKIIKQVFGMFQSMGQNIYQGLHDVTVGWARKNELMDNFQKSTDEHANKAEEYAKKQAEAEEKAKNAKTEEEREKYSEKANEFKFHKEGHEKNAERLKDILKKMKAKYTGRYYANKLSAYVAGLIGSGLALTLIGKLKKKAYGTEEWNDWDIKELSEETAYQSFVNWIPFIGTIANSIRNDSDLSVFTIDNLNSFVDAAKGVIESVQDGDMTRTTGKTLSLLTLSASLFGIPAQSMWKIVNGVWYNIDKESNVSFREAMGLLTSTSIKSGYSDALEKGQKAKAVAYIDVWTGAYSSGSSKEVSEEIYRLNRLGITGVTPSAYPSTYTNDDGETVSITQKETSDYHAIFSKSAQQAKKMVTSSSYAELDDEYKGKALKALWTAYSSAAKNKSYGKAMTSKAAKLVAATNGDIDLARYLVGLQKLSGKSSADAVKAANALSGYSKAEKLLVLWLNGSSLTDSNLKILSAWLIGKGSSASDASELFS